MNRRITAWRFVCRVLSPQVDADKTPGLKNQIESLERMWPEVFRFTDAHLVTPALRVALAHKRLIGHVPDEPLQYMASIYEMNALRNASLLLQLDEAIRALNGCGIAPVLIKGAAYLKEGVFKDSAARIFTDLDVLIAESEIPLALKILGGLGYRPAEDGTDYARHRHVPPMFRPGDYGAIEVHRRCLRKDLEVVLGAGAVWEGLLNRKENGLHYRLLSPTHTVLLSFLHSQVIDRLGETCTIGLRPIQDLLALDCVYGKLIDWNEIYLRLEGHPVHEHLRNYLFAAGRLAGFKARPKIRFSGSQWLHYGLSLARIGWPRIDGLAGRLSWYTVA